MYASTSYRSADCRRCSVKKVFLKILQNSPGNDCARASFLLKLQAQACNFIKKRLWHSCSQVNFENFLRTPFYGTLPMAVCGVNETALLGSHFKVLMVFSDSINPLNRLLNPSHLLTYSFTI